MAPSGEPQRATNPLGALRRSDHPGHGRRILKSAWPLVVQGPTGGRHEAHPTNMLGPPPLRHGPAGLASTRRFAFTPPVTNPHKRSPTSHASSASSSTYSEISA